MASIEKRTGKDGKLYFRIRVSQGTDKSGKRIYAYDNFYPTAKTEKGCKNQAIARAAVFEKEVNEGKYCFDGNTTFEAFTEEWYTAWAKKNLTESQQEAYMGHLSKHVLPIIGNKKLSEIKRRDCKAIVSVMEQNNKAPKTIRRVITSVRSVFKYAISEELIYSNPCDGLELPKLKKDTTLHCFDLEQAKRFLNALTLKYPMKIPGRKRTDSKGRVYEVAPCTAYKEVPFQLVVYFNLAIKTGIRRGEAIALTWADIDFSAKKISITKAVAETKAHGQIVKGTKTESGTREVFVPSDCIDMLSELFEQQKEACMKDTWEGMPLNRIKMNNVFTQYNGTQMHLSTPANRFTSVINHYNEMIEEQASLLSNQEAKEKKLAERLPKIRLHDLRHTYASILISEGVDIVTISKSLGHADVSVTLNIYSHLLQKPAKEAVNKLEMLFAPEEQITAEMRS